MTIHELLQAAGLTANDEIPIWDVDGTGEPTKKVTAQQLATAVVALANLITGVKGNAEGSYRHGNVNLTPANIGALPNTTTAADIGAEPISVSKVVTATTDANGNISLDLNRQTYIVTAVTALSWIATPWVSGGDNNWHARITGINGGPVASQSATVTVYYRPVQ